MLILNRLSSGSAGTFGVLVYDKKPVCYTLELPWLGNVQDRSCIPPGEYPVIKVNTPRFDECFLVKHVPFREGILIHPGNSLKDTRGCILPGLDVDCHSDFQEIVQSRLAMKRLYSCLPSSFQLNIRSV